MLGALLWFLAHVPVRERRTTGGGRLFGVGGLRFVNDLTLQGDVMSGAASAGGLVSMGEQLIQIRTRNQLMIAIQRPRDLKKFETALLAQAAEAGDDFFYSMRFKEHTQGCPRGRCGCPLGDPIEGPGVGLVRAAAALYQNCALETRIESEDENCFHVRSDFLDFENNYSRSETKRVSKLVARRGGFFKAKEKELDLVYQQGASKVERDVGKRSMPVHIINRAFEIAKAAATQETKPIKEQLARLQQRFNEQGVSIKMLEAYLGCEWNEKGLGTLDRKPVETCAHLRGLLTALKGGDTMRDEIFPPITATNPTAASSGIAAGDLGTTVEGDAANPKREEFDIEASRAADAAAAKEQAK
jgi:hypothetical protein